jgi:hypothetical protein
VSNDVRQPAKAPLKRARMPAWAAVEIVLIIAFLLYICQPVLFKAVQWVGMAPSLLFK